MRRIKLALTGKARSGKDTVADYLREEYGMVAFAFGNELKKEFHASYPHIPVLPKPVRGYQLFGQLQRYVVSDEVWIDKCFNTINTVEAMAKGYTGIEGVPDFRPLITDIRQHNEIDRCMEEGFHIIKISAPEELRIERMDSEGDKFDKQVFEFETETTVDEFKVDYEILNYDTIESLKRQVDRVIKAVALETDTIL